jgi:hypothetical protein
MVVRFLLLLLPCYFYSTSILEAVEAANDFTAAFGRRSLPFSFTAGAGDNVIDTTSTIHTVINRAVPPTGGNVSNDISKLFENNSILLSSAILVRGGGCDYYDDDEEEYDDEYEEEDYEAQQQHPPPRSRKPTIQQEGRRAPQRRSTSNGARRPPNRHSPPPRRTPLSSSSRRYPTNNKRRRQQQSKSSSAAILKTTSDLAQKSINMASSATMSTLKTSGRAAYHLTAPKHVNRNEIYGIWRFDQSIGEGSSACAANIEFTFNGDVITRYDEEESVTGYLFQSKSWPRSCSIEFEANAFQGMYDERPVRYYYKGCFRRKMADRSVIKIVGKIYEVKQGRFWKGKNAPGVAGVEVGSFVARKRIQATKAAARGKGEHDIDEDYYDDEYDEYDEYDDYQGEEYEEYDEY